MAIVPNQPVRASLPTPGQEIPLPGGEKLFIGRYLNRGAFGIVHEAYDDWGNELVVKILNPKGRTYEQARQDWEREMKNLVLLRHPHITYVHNAFEHEKAFYIVMERCGGTLHDLFKIPNYDGNIWLLPVARCMLNGISFIHRANHVHKDLHPGNIFWSIVRNEMGAVPSQVITFKVGDLGICRLASEIDFFGTVLAPWMRPPEFLDPFKFGFVGPQTDIYHAGLVLLSVLHGKDLNFTEDQIRSGAPRALAQTIPGPWGVALAKALRRRVAQRTQTALEFWRELNGTAV